MESNQIEINPKIGRRLKILFLSPRFPYPLIGGDRLKTINMLSHLGKNHDVTLVTFNQGGKPPKSYVREIEKRGVKLISVPLSPVKAGLKCAKELHKNLPLEVSYYTQPEFQRVVDILFENQDFDVAISFFIRTAEYLKNKKVKKILMAEDCRTLYQQRSYTQSDNIKQRMIRWWEFKKLKKYEPQIVNHFDITTLVTKEDIGTMKTQNPNAKYRFLTNGVDHAHFAMNESQENREGILFAGKLDVWSNELMIRSIAYDILPYVQKEVPGATLKIVGAKPTHGIKTFVGENIQLFADVPEMPPYMQSSKVFLHPHNGASGIQNKILEAMACGCPVVTTPTGIQGIPAKHGIHVLIGKSLTELTEHTVSLLTNSYFAQEIAINARDMIERSHSWESIFDAFDDILIDVLDD